MKTEKCIVDKICIESVYKCLAIHLKIILLSTQHFQKNVNNIFSLFLHTLDKSYKNIFLISGEIYLYNCLIYWKHIVFGSIILSYTILGTCYNDPKN